MKEWRDILGYEGIYQVSNYGDIKSFVRSKEGRPVATKVNKGGYVQVTLHKNKERKTYSVHRLVAIAFIENPHNKEQVNHINEDKTDNRVENLQWTTPKENCNHGTRVERIVKKQSCKVIGRQVNGSKVIISHSMSALKKAYGFEVQNISHCCNGRAKTAYGYEWTVID